MHQTSNFNSQCIFDVIFFFIFYHDNAHFKKQYFIKPCLFHWGYKPWEYWPIGDIRSFPMGLYSIGVINHAFSIGSMFKHWTEFKFLGIVFHIALVWLCSTSEWLHAVQLFFHKSKFIFKNCLLKFGKISFQETYNINYYLFTVDKKSLHIV